METKLSVSEVSSIARTIADVKSEVAKAFYGHEKVVDSLIRALLCNGHVLIEGVPGIAKTLLIKALAEASGCSFKRVQFTVDLLPSDIIGITTYDPKRGFSVVKGPLFTQFLIADEINRSPPKTQSALIEAMQEGQVSIGTTTFPLPRPFFVMANQNPIESEGVYSLPEAQVDRFLFKVVFSYPQEVDELHIMEHNATFSEFKEYELKARLTPQKILDLQKLTHRIYIDQKIKKYILSLVTKTRNKDFVHGEFISLGASPRASIALFIAAKAEALIRGRNYVLPQDVQAVIYDVLRHRVLLNYRARSEQIQIEQVISELVKSVRLP
ncbi:MAG TPA: MoxR family ATPase [Candidatus Nanoarchaeia archaeon]|nr:MoxR family ATPase [Candidatus Nanoarchaeia archaeon]